MALSCFVWFGGGYGRRGKLILLYFTTCLQAAWIQSNKQTYNINDLYTETHVWEGPNLLALLFWGTVRMLRLKVRGQRHPWTFQNMLQTRLHRYNCKAELVCLLWDCSCNCELPSHSRVVTAYALKAIFLLHIIPIFLAEHLVHNCWCHAMPVSPGSFPKGEGSLMHR